MNIRILLSILFLAICTAMSAQTTNPIEPLMPYFEGDENCCYELVVYPPITKEVKDSIVVCPGWTEYIQTKPTFKQTKRTITSDKVVSYEKKGELYCRKTIPASTTEVKVKVFDTLPKLKKIVHDPIYEYHTSLRVIRNGYKKWAKVKCLD